ncbi:MAG TPA: META domain-containing protein [Saprospiraceae bacterium]|nr:META domain-containing protein [Saprospiraceae bacterium]
MLHRLLLLVLFYICITSCNISKSDNSSDATTKGIEGQSWMNQKWTLEEINGRPVSTLTTIKANPFIQFDSIKGLVSGNAGCNTFTGAFKQISDTTLELSPLAATKKACQDMQLEDMFFELITKDGQWMFQDGFLIFGQSITIPWMKFKPEIITDMHSSRLALDWQGVYKGVLPCADCEGILTVIRLREDHTFHLQRKYIGKSDKVFMVEGAFSWTEDGGAVVWVNIDPTEMATRYKVGENKIMQMDLNGGVIEGKFKDQYILGKVSEGIKDKNWVLVRLEGKPVTHRSEDRNKPHIVLYSHDNQLRGYAGCNTIMGHFHVDHQMLDFSEIGATRMMCPDMNIESALLKALDQTTKYALKEDVLTLQSTDGVAMAVFEVDYMQ